MPASTTRPKSPACCGASRPKVTTSRSIGLVLPLTTTGRGAIAATSASSRLSTIAAALAEDARLRTGIRVHRAVPVEVVLRHVEHGRGGGLEVLDAIELEARQLEHPDLGQRRGLALFVLRVERGGERVEHRRPDVAGRGDAAAAALDQQRGQRGRRRLAVGAGDRDRLAARRRARPSDRPARERTGRVRLGPPALIARGLQQRSDALVARRQARALQHELHALQRVDRSTRRWRASPPAPPAPALRPSAAARANPTRAP